MLASIARGIDNCTRRAGDIAEEFSILLPGTSMKDAFELAERVRASVLALPAEQKGGPDNVPTISIGVAAMVPRADLEPRDLVEAADNALYQAKSGGRNRSVKAAVRLVDRVTIAA